MLVRTAAKWGVVLGVAVCVWTLALHLLGWYTTNLRMGLIADQVAIVLPVVTLFLAIREHGRRLGRAPTLKEAESVGLLAALVSVPISAGFLWIYHHFINPRWLEYLIAHERQRLTSDGAGPETIEAAVTRLQSGGTDGAQIVGALVGTLIIAVAISFLSWGILRIPRRPT